MKIRQELLNPRTAPPAEEPAFVTAPEPRYFLSLRCKTGHHRALAYSDIFRIDFEAQTGIELVTAHGSIRLSGRELGDLYAALLERRVVEVRESETGERADFFQPAAGTVLSIRWESE